MPILTLTTDIGQRDYITGAIKGQFLSLLPSLAIADITHYLSQTNFPQAAYTCNNAFKYYPAGTFHVVIVNLFESPVKHILIARHNDQFIICPDNGLLTIINDIEEKYPLRATLGPNWMEGQILFIDNFENVVINITKEEFVEQRNGRSFKIVFKRNEVIETISDNYTSVSESEKLAWFNSAGYLEIALRNGNMAGLFGLQGFNEQMQQTGSASVNKWFYQTVRIFFE
jgi:S-adenosylmethionine hydrolase